jgi:hypothetical protein
MANEVVFPRPVVTWRSVVQADDPTRAVTPGRLRELRKKHRVTAGVTVPVRGARGLEGRATYHSVLSVLATRSHKEGHPETAVQTLQAAERLESAFAARLKSFLSEHTLAELPTAEFFEELSTETAKCAGVWSKQTSSLLAVAQVGEIDDGLAHLEGTSPRGESLAVDLPSALLEPQKLGLGDVVWIFNRFVGDAAVIVELLPAMHLGIDMETDEALRALPSLDRTPFPSSSFDPDHDGLTNELRTAYAGRFSAGVGANLSADDLTALHQDMQAGRVPRRPLRPAG